MSIEGTEQQVTNKRGASTVPNPTRHQLCSVYHTLNLFLICFLKVNIQYIYGDCVG